MPEMHIIIIAGTLGLLNTHVSSSFLHRSQYGRLHAVQAGFTLMGLSSFTILNNSEDAAEGTYERRKDLPSAYFLAT